MKTVPFAEAITDVSRGNKKIPQSAFLAAGALPIVDQGRGLVAGYTDDQTLAVLAKPPIIVFGDHTRALKFIDFPFAVGADGVKLLQTTQGFDPKYAYHFLRSQHIPSLGYSRHFKVLKELRVPKPPLPEQQRIAAILDQADAIRAKRRQALAHLTSLSRAIFHEMFSTVSETRPLSDVATTASGGTPDRKIADYYGGDVPWVKSGELHSGVITSAEEHITRRGLAESSAKLFPPGTVLLAMYGATAGVVAQLGVPAATNQAICAITPHPTMNADFLIAALRAEATRLVTKASGGAQPNLSQAIIRSTPIPSASVDAQRRFGGFSRAIEGQRTALATALAADDELFVSLQHRAFRGEL